jgi:hypothetical protein
MGFMYNGTIYFAHTVNTSNLIAVPSSQSNNFPVRMESRTGASTTVSNSGVFDSANGLILTTTRSVAGGTIYFSTASVESDGVRELSGTPIAAPTGITTTAVTTRRPVLSIRPKATYNSRTNRAQLIDADIAMRVTTNDCYYEIVLGGTLTGAAFGSVGAYSVAEYDVTATAITGGITVVAGSALSGSGSSAQKLNSAIDTRSPLVLSQIDALTANQTILTLVCTSFTGTSNIVPTAQWHELAT